MTQHQPKSYEALAAWGIVAAILTPPAGFFIGLALVGRDTAATAIIATSLVVTWLVVGAWLLLPLVF